MIVAVYPADEGVLRAGLELHAKKLKAARSLLDLLNVPTLGLDVEAGNVEYLLERINAKTSELGPLQGSLELSTEVLMTVRVTVQLYRGKGEAVKDEQQELSWSTEEAELGLERALNLYNRLLGQPELGDDARVLDPALTTPPKKGRKPRKE